MKHTGDKAPSNVVGFLERVLVHSKINDDKQPRFLVGWALGHKDADIITLMEDGSVLYNGSWKNSPEGRSDANVHELQSALTNMKNTKPKVQGCLACEYGINVSLGRRHTFECRHTILPSLVTSSLWTVKFDADGKGLKRHEHEGDAEHRDSKRVRFTYKRADMELTDDTVATRAKLFDTPSFLDLSFKGGLVGRAAQRRAVRAIFENLKYGDEYDVAHPVTLWRLRRGIADGGILACMITVPSTSWSVARCHRRPLRSRDHPCGLIDSKVPLSPSDLTCLKEGNRATRAAVMLPQQCQGFNVP